MDHTSPQSAYLASFCQEATHGGSFPVDAPVPANKPVELGEIPPRFLRKDLQRDLCFFLALVKARLQTSQAAVTISPDRSLHLPAQSQLESDCGKFNKQVLNTF